MAADISSRNFLFWKRQSWRRRQQTRQTLITNRHDVISKMSLTFGYSIYIPFRIYFRRWQVILNGGIADRNNTRSCFIVTNVGLFFRSTTTWIITNASPSVKLCCDVEVIPSLLSNYISTLQHTICLNEYCGLTGHDIKSIRLYVCVCVCLS
jgi:hypothetical protein